MTRFFSQFRSLSAQPRAEPFPPFPRRHPEPALWVKNPGSSHLAVSGTNYAGSFVLKDGLRMTASFTARRQNREERNKGVDILHPWL